MLLRSFLLSLVSSCSLTTVTPLTCETNSACRDVFGYGSVCTPEGTCDASELHPRCETVYPPDLTLPVDSSTTFVVGTVFDHELNTHIGRYQSAQLAVKQANENGGLENKSFALIHCSNTPDEDGVLDGLDKDAATVETATWLADVVGVPAIVGPAASGRSEAVYNEVSTVYDMLLVSPSATSTTLTPLDGERSTDEMPGLLWRTAAPDDDQAIAISRDMLDNVNDDGLSPDIFRTSPSLNVGVVFQLGAYGGGMNDAFRTAHQAAGGTVTSYQFDNDSTRNDAVLDALGGGHDEVLFVSSDSPDVIAFLQAAVTNINAEGLPVFLTDSARNSDVLGADVDGLFEIRAQIRGTAPASPAGDEYQGFVSAYASEYNGADVAPLSFTAQAFDAAWLVLYGHAWAVSNEDEVTGTTVARGLRKVSGGASTPVRASSWNAVKAAFMNGNSVDLVGASGALDYDPATGETSAPTNVWRMVGYGLGGQEASFEVVDTIE